MLLHLLRIPLVAIVWLSYRSAATWTAERRASASSRSSPVRYMRTTRRAAALVANSIISAVLLEDTVFTTIFCLPRSSGTSAFLAFLTRDKLSGTPAVTITPTFLAGVLLITVRTYVRTQCLNKLGRLFTFNLALRDRHELVTTGPYSIARHPAYPARFAVLLSASICTFGARSWWKDTDQGSTAAGKLVSAAWMATIARDVVLLLFVMVPKEKMLRKTFGKQWMGWASKTRYKMIPGIW